MKSTPLDSWILFGVCAYQRLVNGPAVLGDGYIRYDIYIYIYIPCIFICGKGNGYALSHCKAPFLKTSCCVGFLGVRTGTTQRNHHSSRHLSRAKNSLDVVFLPHPGGIPHKLPQGGMGGIKIIRGVLAGNCEPKWARFACLDLAHPH